MSEIQIPTIWLDKQPNLVAEQCGRGYDRFVSKSSNIYKNCIFNCTDEKWGPF